jgi:hypothetical protein
MKLSKTHWMDISLVVLSVCLVLPVYLLNRQYAQAAGGKALFEARTDKANYPEKYNNTLPDNPHAKPKPETHNPREEPTIGTFQNMASHPSDPEIYHRRKVAVANWMLWLFLFPLLGSLTARRWIACMLIVILWLFTWHLQGLKY